jgi:hypothetical protein
MPARLGFLSFPILRFLASDITFEALIDIIGGHSFYQGPSVSALKR